MSQHANCDAERFFRFDHVIIADAVELLAVCIGAQKAVRQTPERFNSFAYLYNIHFPSHFPDSYPHSLHTNTVLFFAMFPPSHVYYLLLLLRKKV